VQEEDAGLIKELQLRQGQIADEEATFVSGEVELKELEEARMSLTRQLAERDEAMRYWGRVSNADDGARGEAVYALAQQEDAVEALAAARVEATELDEQLRFACESLQTSRDDIAASKLLVKQLSGKHMDALEAWGTVLDAQRRCGLGLQVANSRLQDASGRLEVERTQRSELRCAIREVAGCLTALDNQLEALEIQDHQAAALADVRGSWTGAGSMRFATGAAWS